MIYEDNMTNDDHLGRFKFFVLISKFMVLHIHH
jgi:hypothetical protein